MEFIFVSPGEHSVYAFEWLYATNEHCVGDIGNVCDDIEQVVYAVAEVDIGDSAGGIHGLGAGGAPAAIGVGGFICDACIGFGFGDDTGGGDAIEVGDEYLAEEFFGYGNYIISSVK